MPGQSRSHDNPQLGLGTLSRLPSLARDMIYDYLLGADNVKAYSDRISELQKRDAGEFLHKFDFSILRVSHQIYKEARRIFLLNGIVKVIFISEAAPYMLKALDFPISLYTAKTEGINGHIAQIDVKLQACKCGENCAGHKKTPDKPFAFIIFLNELPNLTQWFQRFDVAYGTGFNVVIKLLGQTSEGVQRKILLPFKIVTGFQRLQSVSITGKGVDKRLATQVQEAMTQKVLWLRRTDWIIYFNCLSLKQDADQMFQAGSMMRSAALYENAGHVLARYLKELKPRAYDDQLLAAFYRLDAICAANHLLALAHEGTLPSQYDPCSEDCCPCRPIWQGGNDAPKAFYATVCILHHACHITAGVDEEQMGSCTCLIPVKSGALQELYNVVGSAIYSGLFHTSTAHGKPEDESALLVNKVRSLLPRRPFDSPKVEPYSDPIATYERAIARAMGLSDEDLACDMIVDDSKTTVRSSVVKRHVKKLNQDLESQITRESRLPKGSRLYSKAILNLKDVDIFN